jgi:hypothetical protein
LLFSQAKMGYFMLPTIAGITGVNHHTQLSSDDMVSHEQPSPRGWPRTVILLVLASCVA